MTASALARQRGVSLVEMLVALAVGLFIVAVATTLLAIQLRENRALLVETRVMQDLRTAADLITRDLRRAGYWGHAAQGRWSARNAALPRINPYLAPAAIAASDAVDLRYSRDAVENDAVDRNERFGYRLRAGTIELQLGQDNWQALTDPSTLTVTEFVLTPALQQVSLGGACRRPCAAGAAGAAGAAACPPTLQVRSLALRIVARSTVDPRVVRSLGGEVRQRNDVLVGACPS